MDQRLNSNRYEMINLLIHIYGRLQLIQRRGQQQEQEHEFSMGLTQKNLVQSSITTIFRDILEETLR